METNLSYFDDAKILAPFDFSELSETAVETAMQIAGKNENVTVLHVIDPTPVLDYGSNLGYEVGGGIDNDSYLEVVAEIDETHQRRALESLRTRFGDARYAGLNFATAINDAAHGITDYAEHQNFNLIVLPSHGRTGVKRLLIGSTAERVVRLAHCPVLVLRS